MKTLIVLSICFIGKKKKIRYELFLQLSNSYSGDGLSESSIVGLYRFHGSYF